MATSLCMIGGVLDFLLVVELAAAGIAGGVDVPQDVFRFFQPANEIAVHDLHVVHVEQQLHAGRADTAEDAGHIIEVVPLVTGVPLHRMRVVPRVEMFDAHVDAVRLRIAGDLF